MPRNRNGITVVSSPGPDASPTAAQLAPGAERRQRRVQGRPADVVDNPGPAFAPQRSLRRFRQLLAADDDGCAEVFQVIVGFFPPGRRSGPVAQVGQQRHGDAPDPARCAGDQHLAFGLGGQSVFLQGHDRQHRREAGGADGHRLFGAQTIGQRHQPVGLDPGPGRITAPVNLADPPAGQHDLIAGLVIGGIRGLDGAGEVDAGHVGGIRGPGARSLG